MLDRRQLLAWGALLLASPPAHAWRLPGPHLLRRADRRLKRKGGLRASLVGRLRTADGPTAVSERWTFAATRHVEAEIVGVGGRRAGWKRQQAPDGDPALAPDELTREVFTMLFADADVSGLARALKVNLDEGHLAPVGDRVAHVLGASHAQRRDRRLASLWIDQATFEVLRVVAPGGAGTVRLEEWGGPLGQGAFPSRVDVTVGGRWSRRLETKEVLGG